MPTDLELRDVEANGNCMFLSMVVALGPGWPSVERLREQVADGFTQEDHDTFVTIAAGNTQEATW